MKGDQISCIHICFVGNCSYGADLAKELAAMLQNVLWSCGSVRISFSRRTPEKVLILLDISLEVLPAGAHFLWFMFLIGVQSSYKRI